MKQVYHSNASTNVKIRTKINIEKVTYRQLAKKYEVSKNTIAKWKNRSSFKDKSSRPHKIKYTLNTLQQLIVVSLRTTTWWSLDEIAEIINPQNPNTIRSALYRTFARKGVNKIPKKEKQKNNKFKDYNPGYLHMDVTYLPKIEGKKNYLFVAIDRATRTLFYKLYHTRTSTNTQDFTKQCMEFFPFKITHILTDNGLEFTNRPIKNNKAVSYTKPSKLDVLCKQHNIKHCTTKPYTPKTNGMVEKANDIIKQKTVKIKTYQNIKEMNDDLMQFLIFYNLYRRHGSLRKELKVKTPYNAVEKWHELEPTIFKEKPFCFKNKLLLLHKEKQVFVQQPCET